MQIILASSSPYRKKLLARLGVNFDALSPDIDETPQPGEQPDALALRLAHEKANRIAEQRQGALIIASDQVAAVETEILSKPGSEQRARQQLAKCNGKHVNFYTSLVLHNTSSNTRQEALVPFAVTFRQLSEAQLADYVKRDQPLDCAGSFKWESLGIALFAAMSGSDVTALEGLPLISLVKMLENEGLDVLTAT